MSPSQPDWKRRLCFVPRWLQLTAPPVSIESVPNKGHASSPNQFHAQRRAGHERWPIPGDGQCRVP
jgi:hypothetical protein